MKWRVHNLFVFLLLSMTVYKSYAASLGANAVAALFDGQEYNELSDEEDDGSGALLSVKTDFVFDHENPLYQKFAHPKQVTFCEEESPLKCEGLIRPHQSIPSYNLSEILSDVIPQGRASVLSATSSVGSAFNSPSQSSRRLRTDSLGSPRRSRTASLMHQYEDAEHPDTVHEDDSEHESHSEASTVRGHSPRESGEGGFQDSALTIEHEHGSVQSSHGSPEHEEVVHVHTDELESDAHDIEISGSLLPVVQLPVRRTVDAGTQTDEPVLSVASGTQTDTPDESSEVTVRSSRPRSRRAVVIDKKATLGVIAKEHLSSLSTSQDVQDELDELKQEKETLEKESSEASKKYKELQAQFIMTLFEKKRLLRMLQLESYDDDIWDRVEDSGSHPERVVMVLAMEVSQKLKQVAQELEDIRFSGLVRQERLEEIDARMEFLDRKLQRLIRKDVQEIKEKERVLPQRSWNSWLRATLFGEQEISEREKAKRDSIARRRKSLAAKKSSRADLKKLKDKDSFKF